MTNSRTPKFWKLKLTFTQQLVLASFLAMLPLVLAVIYACQSLAGQTNEHRRLLLLISMLKDLDAEVGKQVAGLERAGQQYLLIGDKRFQNLYDDRLEMLQVYRRELVFTAPASSALKTLNEITDKIEEIRIQYLKEKKNASDTEINAAWQNLRNTRNKFTDHVKQLIQQSVRESQLKFETVLKRVLFICSLALPGTVLLISLSTATVIRPLWSLRDAILRLGQNQLQIPVRVSGPADFVELGQCLEWMRGQLQASQLQKQAFMQHITHELKSPLAAISEAQKLLHEQIPGKLNTQQQNVLTIMSQNTASLRELIQQLLNYNAIKHSVRPEIKAIEMQPFCQNICQTFNAQIIERNIQLHCKGIAKSVKTDMICLQMIISNLLSNAINVVPQAGLIHLSWGIGGEDWWLLVEDSGPGIDPREVENLFKPFFQGSFQRRGALKGSGIGLSIVYESVDLLRGKITVGHSELGGARFSLHFPKR